MKTAYYEGSAYRTSKIKNMIEWFETLRFKWGADAVITIKEIENEPYDTGGFKYKIRFEVPDGVEDVNEYIREREGLCTKNT